MKLWSIKCFRRRSQVLLTQHNIYFRIYRIGNSYLTPWSFCVYILWVYCAHTTIIQSANIFLPICRSVCRYWCTYMFTFTKVCRLYAEAKNPLQYTWFELKLFSSHAFRLYLRVVLWKKFLNYILWYLFLSL